ncbi:helix-turn-helix transcriptional regulator [Enterococcus montenegrensis]|uniref:helix-turn-helix domain-containing protein n=1 Tax=Enterococcus TaxID=1350 RepID=UPI001E3EB2F1|nr:MULTISPECIES: helix-turn-helix transcriptional regulator [Enterococcus]MCD1025745.1 helix-turn-helix domain-containing protein [Enterococcus sp. SMC-9]WHA08828.1 helix-turn-helix transcriptional regulator [Enterococcus montenegrensis]
MLLDRIKILLNERSMTLAELERKMNFSNGSMSRWNKTIPSVEKVQKVADYFDVSTDYLLGRTENKYAGLSDEQRKMTIEEALKSAMGKDGKEIAKEDIPVLERIIEAFLDGK